MQEEESKEHGLSFSENGVSGDESGARGRESDRDGRPVKPGTHDDESDRGQKDRVDGLSKGDVARFGVLVGILVLFVALTVALWSYIAQFTSQEGTDRLTDIVRDSGPLGIGILLLAQLLQVVIAFIPGEVVQIAAGALYGPLWGTVIVLVGACLSTMLIYTLVRRLGMPFVSKVVPEDIQKKLGFVSDSSRLDFIVFLLFLIPGLPKDIITYVVALTAIRPARFFLLSTVGRAPGVIVSSFAGYSLAEGEWLILLAIGIVAVAIILVVYLNRDKVFAHLGGMSSRRGTD